ncbi:MAG: THUMP domain-containing class I SAM-dependent RNA methyltransferase, partial [Myxococcaceae bacterium]
PERLSLYATAARGTEPLLTEELRELGAAKVRQDRGGVRFAANINELLRISLWTRIAMRILYPLEEMEAKGAEGLYEAAHAVPWEEHLTPSTTFAVEATLKGSEHLHSGFVALKIKDGIVDRLRQKLGARPDVDTKNPVFQVVAHLAGTKLSLSFDLAGDPLNRRGYRTQPTVAPLKETLAAAILRAAAYTGDEPLVDPMCGSGTLLIEGGMIACRRAPALNRSFAVERWPSHAAQAKEILNGLRQEARAYERQAPYPIIGLDKSDEAVEAATRNVKAARLSREIEIREGDATAPLPVDNVPPGLLVTNPPYGDRLTGGHGQKGMKSFYFKLGDNLAPLLKGGWRMSVLCGNPAFESAFHARPTARRELWNGPIECALYGYGAPTRGV